MPPEDPWPQASNPAYIAERWFAITPNDAADLTIRPWAVDCTGSGTAVFVSADGDEVTVMLNAGYPYPARPVRIKAAGTTASGIFGLY